VAAETGDDLLDRARAAILNGDLAAAEQALSGIKDDVSDVNDVDFLRGTLAVQKGDYDTAIAAFKAMLARDPTLNRVRLDLAQAYYLKGDDEAAVFHFRAALAQGVPPEVQHNVTAFLEDIRRRKKWEAEISIAAAPDSNINAATTDDTVSLFGLPFVLDPTAQRKSGIGLSLAAGGTYRWQIAEDMRLKTGIAGVAREYSDPDFSDRNVSALVGPVFLFGGDNELAVLATASRRWYGTQGFTRSAGVRLEAQHTLSPRWLLSGGTSWENRTYDQAQYADYSGPVYGLFGALTYALDATSLLQGSLAVVREQANFAPYRAWQYISGFTYYRENVWRKFAVGLSVQPAYIAYDEALMAFGKIRKDTQVDYRISVSNSSVDVWGFTPVVSVIHSDRYSNISLFTYHRNRAEIGVRRNF
jgi:tetratricopeptide (TPR) repeat protein